MIEKNRGQGIVIKRRADIAGIKARKLECVISRSKDGEFGFGICNGIHEPGAAQCLNESREIAVANRDFGDRVVARLKTLCKSVGR